MDAMIVMLPLFVMILLRGVSVGSAEESFTPAAPALYVFGDSLFDSGNNNQLPTIAKADYSPYGMDFERGPTGRFTNGRTVVDFIAEFLGLPYSPPYLSLQGRILGQDEMTGLNFASGACGILPETGQIYGKCLSLGDQVNLFKTVVENKLSTHFKGEDDLSNYLSKSIFMISVGNNDYLGNYHNIANRMLTNYSPQEFAKLLIDNLSFQLQRLYSLGARKVVMFEIGPIGCVPSVRKQFRHNGLCAEDINQLAVIFNNQLAAMLQNLSSSLEGSSFILGHGYWLGYETIISPSKYGISDSSNPCCVAWFNGTSGCIPELKALVCKDPNKHFFWDGYHLTETVYKTIASLCFNGSSVCIPKNIKDLLQI